MPGQHVSHGHVTTYVIYLARAMGRIQAAEIETEVDEIDEMPPPVQSPDGEAPAEEEARTQPDPHPGETSDPSKVSEAAGDGGRVSQVHSVEGTGAQTSAELGGGAPSRAADRAGHRLTLWRWA